MWSVNNHAITDLKERWEIMSIVYQNILLRRRPITRNHKSRSQAYLPRHEPLDDAPKIGFVNASDVAGRLCREDVQSAELGVQFLGVVGGDLLKSGMLVVAGHYMQIFCLLTSTVFASLIISRSQPIKLFG